MKVQILNIEELQNLFKYYGEFSCICYNTPKKFAERVGKSCLQTGHYSGSRSRHIIFEFEGISRACYDEETDILTDKGWKNFKDIGDNEVVATLNSQTGKVEYHKINERIQYEYTGNMYKIKNSSIDLNITSNHNVFFKKTDSVYKYNNHTTHLIPIDKVKTSKIMMDKRFKYENKVDDFITIKGFDYNRKNRNGEDIIKNSGDLTLNRKDYYKLLAWYISDGSTHYDKKENKYVISISQTKCKENIENNTVNDIIDLVNKLGFKANYDNKRIRFNSMTLGKLFKELGTSGIKTIPLDIKNDFNEEYSKLFLNEYFKGDGHIDKNGVGFLYTSSNYLADQLQEICFIAGYTAYKREKEAEKIGKTHTIDGRTVIKNLPSYVINVSFGVRNSQPNINLKKNMVIEPAINKMVYCVNVTNNIIFVRRNGKAIWCGNCADQMVRHCIGTSVNMQSGRYVNLENFNYHTPNAIKRNEKALRLYEEHMYQTQLTYKEICKELEKDGLKGEKVYECARGIAPMNHHTKLTMSFTIEALINFMNKRLCVCSQQEIRQVALKMKEQVLLVIPDLQNYLVPICEANLWCPEAKNRSCHAFPQKSEVMLAISEAKSSTKKH